MKPPKSPVKAPKKRNLAAKALSDPLFRPKVEADPRSYKRRPKFIQKEVDSAEDDQIN